MVSYRIRSAFRVLAAVVSVAGVAGVGFLIKHPVSDAEMIVLVAVLILGFAVPFGAIAWFGRVPAWTAFPVTLAAFLVLAFVLLLVLVATLP